ncbi:MAG: hypothetical protein M1826_002391 [Phylliscum demangeonii]|nr:MAG: hypothetical protein M1826_002391 [Phylliscum demangeonii]
MMEMQAGMRDNAQNGVASLICSLNADCKRWAPGFVMGNFMHSAFNGDINHSIKDFMLTLISSFSSKKIMISKQLKDKWDKKPREEVEYFRVQVRENGWLVEIMSRMGQGMMHYNPFSIDDGTDLVVSDDVEQRREFTTPISSDNKTKVSSFVVTKLNQLENTMKVFVITFNLGNRLANIHRNWKKSTLNLWIAEFISLCSIGKRRCWATLKDLTSPKDNIRRCMEYGMYLTTLKTLLIAARLQLIEYYRYSWEDIKKLMDMLGIKDETVLPYQLGFVPIDMIYETLIYGPEIHMFRSDIGMKQKYFYEKLSSATSNDRKNLMKDGPLLGGGLLEVLNDPKSHMNFVKTDLVGMSTKDEFQNSVAIHSLIRALHLSESKGVICSKDPTYWDTEMEIKTLRKKMKNSLNKEKQEAEIKEKELYLSNTDVD